MFLAACLFRFRQGVDELVTWTGRTDPTPPVVREALVAFPFTFTESSSQGKLSVFSQHTVVLQDGSLSLPSLIRRALKVLVGFVIKSFQRMISFQASLVKDTYRAAYSPLQHAPETFKLAVSWIRAGECPSRRGRRLKCIRRSRGLPLSRMTSLSPTSF